MESRCPTTSSAVLPSRSARVAVQVPCSSWGALLAGCAKAGPSPAAKIRHHIATVSWYTMSLLRLGHGLVPPCLDHGVHVDRSRDRGPGGGSDSASNRLGAAASTTGPGPLSYTRTVATRASPALQHVSATVRRV